MLSRETPCEAPFGAEVVAVARARRSERIMSVLLVVVGVPLAIGGAIVLSGGADAESEAGRVSHPGAAGLALLVIAGLSCTAAVLLRRQHRLGLAAATAATVALAGLAAFRLWRFGVFGLGDVLVPACLVALIVGGRSRGAASGHRSL